MSRFIHTKMSRFIHTCTQVCLGFEGFWCDAHWTWNLAPSEKSKINSTLWVIAISADPLNMLLFSKVCDPLLTAVFTSRHHVACNTMPHTRAQVDRNATVGNHHCWTLNTSDKESAALVAFLLSVRASVKEWKLIPHHSWDNDTNNVKHNIMQYFWLHLSGLSR